MQLLNFISLIQDVPYICSTIVGADSYTSLKKHGSFILACVHFIQNINFLLTVALKEHSSSYLSNVTVN
jgi:hypothetical protein